LILRQHGNVKKYNLEIHRVVAELFGSN
jgi:hypothetical protein